MNSDFEKHLAAGLRPSAPSTRLKDRIAARLARDRETEAPSAASAAAPAMAASPQRPHVTAADFPRKRPVAEAEPWYQPIISGWSRWLIPAAGACAAAIAVVATVPGLRPGAKLPIAEVQSPGPIVASTFSEVPLQTEESLVYDKDQVPMKVIRTSSQATYTWEDPETRQEITTTFPREHIDISRLDTQ